MRAIPTTNPRRRPRQARAQATVDAIVKATARVLVEEGYDRARSLVRGMIAAYRTDPQLHHVLCQEVPKVGELQRVYDFEQHLGEACRRQLFGVSEATRTIDVDRAVFLLVNAVPSVVRAAIQADPVGEGDERLAEELTDMMVRYLIH